MLIDVALHFAAHTNYLGLQIRGLFVIHLLELLSLNVKNAFETSATVHMCLHVSDSRPSHVAMAVIQFLLITKGVSSPQIDILLTAYFIIYGIHLNRSFVSNENGTFLLIDRVLRYLTMISLSDEDKYFRFAMSVCPK